MMYSRKNPQNKEGTNPTWYNNPLTSATAFSKMKNEKRLLIYVKAAQVLLILF